MSDVCLECTLISPQCDGSDMGCKFFQIKRRSKGSLFAESRRNLQLKQDIVCILTVLNDEKLTRREMVMAITKAQRAERVRKSRFKKRMEAKGDAKGKYFPQINET